MHIAAYSLIVEHTIPCVEQLRNVFKEKSEAFMKVVKIGRNPFYGCHAAHAWSGVSGYVSQLDHSLRTIRHTLPHLSELALGGSAVGTGINVPKGYAEEVARQIAQLSGHPFITAENKFEALAAHDAIVAASGALKTLAVSLMKIANDIRILGPGFPGGIGEITIPENEPGSSIMPGKVNPTQSWKQ